jgi:hypothetical protein
MDWLTGEAARLFSGTYGLYPWEQREGKRYTSPIVDRLGTRRETPRENSGAFIELGNGTEQTVPQGGHNWWTPRISP